MESVSLLLLLVMVVSVTGRLGAPTVASRISGDMWSAILSPDETDVLYVVSLSEMLVVNVSNKAAPKTVGTFACTGDCQMLQGASNAGNYVYLVYWATFQLNLFGVKVIDVSNASDPIEVSSIDTRNVPTGAVYDAGTVYLYGLSGIELWDVRNARAPRLLHKSLNRRCDALAVREKLLFTVAHGVNSSLDTGMFRVIDEGTDPPSTLLSMQVGGLPDDVWVTDNVMYLAYSSGSRGIEVYDVQSVRQGVIRQVGQTSDGSGSTAIWLDAAHSVLISAGSEGVKFFALRDPFKPQLVSSWTGADIRDVTADPAGWVYATSNDAQEMLVLDAVFPDPTAAPPTAAPPTAAPPTAAPPTAAPPTAAPPTAAPPSPVPSTSVPPAPVLTSFPLTATPASPFPLTQESENKHPALPPPQLSGSMTTGSAVAGSGAVGAMVTGSNGGTSVTRSVVLAKATLCTEVEDEPLPFLQHPLSFRVAGSYWAGAIVGNYLLSCGIFVVYFCVYRIIYSTSTQKNKLGIAGFVRYPMLVVPFQLMLMPSVFENSVNILLNSTPGTLGFGVFGVVSSTAYLIVLFWYGNVKQAKCRFVRPTDVGVGPVTHYLLGDAAWESLEDYYVERIGILFDCFVELPRLRGNYLAIDFAHMVPLTYIAAVSNIKPSQCVYKTSVLTLVMLAQTLATSLVRCYIASFLQHLNTLTCCITTASLFCAAVSHGRTQSLSGFWGGASEVLMDITIYLAIIRSVYDVVLFFMDLHTGYRSALLNKGGCERAGSEAGDVYLTDLSPGQLSPSFTVGDEGSNSSLEYFDMEPVSVLPSTRRSKSEVSSRTELLADDDTAPAIAVPPFLPKKNSFPMAGGAASFKKSSTFYFPDASFRVP